MKKAFVILLLSVCWHVQAQNTFAENTSAIKIGGGYSKDFPGLTGYALNVEYTYSLHDRLEGGFGIKRLNMTGHPRTSLVKEYTKATTLDFNVYFLALSNERNKIRIGAGYSFSFYKMRRSYPVIETHGMEKTTSWPIQDFSGRSSGVILAGEYEYIVSPVLSLGLKASLAKAYDRIFYVGPYAGIRL
jgi:hypothetical protein